VSPDEAGLNDSCTRRAVGAGVADAT